MSARWSGSTSSIDSDIADGLYGPPYRPSDISVRTPAGRRHHGSVTSNDSARSSRARALWQYGEPVHAITYFAPETRAATDALGLKGGWMSYFACRAAPLGAVTAPVVTALFYNFRPQMVARAIPDAWRYADPTAVLDARLGAIDGAMRRVLGDDVATASSVARAADLAAAAIAGCDMAGRPMGAANQVLPSSAEPHLRL